MKRYYADRTGLNVLRILMFIVTAIVAFLTYRYLSFIPIFMWSIMLVFITICFFVAIIYLPLYFKSVNYYATDRKIIKHSGVFYKTNQVMRFDSIQYTTVISTLFSKKTGFNFVMLNAFGGRMILTFLKQRDLEEIMSEVQIYK
ncbi:MAG TPA: PH domain-containing protein [Clostridiales bacterium]|nr:PH domain-containing protein [Clostridiales bacterium]